MEPTDLFILIVAWLVMLGVPVSLIALVATAVAGS